MPPIGTSSQQTLLLDDFETAIDEILSQSGSGETRPELCPYPDSIFPRISRQLELANKATWSLRPRTYTVLRLINRLDALNGFIAEGLFDISLPYTGQTLPTVLKNPSARAKFLEHQHLVLSPQAASVESNEHPHRHFSDDGNMHFVPIKKLGSGAYGQVDHVWSRLSANEYARKRISRGRTFQRDKKAIQDFEKELRTLKKLSHRHLVSYVGSYTDPKYVAILMAPVADMNLMEYLKIDPFPIDQLATLRHYFGCLASALVYLHANKIRHKDIKPHNILVHLDNILISDFGTSLDWSDRSCSASQGKPATFSPKYCAPEVREHMIRGSSADIYSLGYVFLEMLTVLRGQSLEKINDIQSTVNPEDYPNTAQRAGELWIASLSSKLSCTYDDEPLEWIADMLRVEPKERPSAQELLNQIQLSIGNFIGSCCADGSEGSVDSSYAGSVCSMMPTPKQREYAMSNPDTSKNGITAPTEFHSYEALSGPESPSSPSNGDTVALREVPPSHRTQAQDRQGDNSTNSQTSVLQKLGNSATNPNLPSKEFSTDNIAFALTAQERFVMAVKTDDVPTMRRCLEQGADVNFPDSEGRTALFHAAFEGSCPAIAILLSEGADATLKANDGWTALHGAAFQGHKEAVMLLLHSGADVNQRGCYEPTAFMYAIENGHIATAQVLLDNG
ncbi:kinase-like protein, partial [Glonium stellatum]